MTMKRILFLFFFFFLILTSSFAQTSKMSIEGKPKKSSDEMVGKRDSNGKFCAAIQVMSDMDGFKYQSYNGVVDVDDQPGRDMVYLSPDERVLEIFKSGYRPLKIILSEYGIQLGQKDVWQITIKGRAKTGDLLPVTFLIEPWETIITVDGKNAESGQPVKLSKGSHELIISKQGYKTISETITVSESKVLFNYSLNEVELQAVQIKSIPIEARIYLDNVEKGVTDKGIFLYPGQYALKLSMTGYLDINKTLVVTEGGNNVFIYNLDKNSGNLGLMITPNDAKVLINKEDYSNKPDIELAPGMYKLEVSRNGFHSQDETITIERGQTLRKTYNLIAKTGKLQFNIQPLVAKVNLKQNGLIVPSWSGMKYIKDLQVGNYELECTASDYSPQTKQITIYEDQATITDITLREGNSQTASISGSGSTYGTMTDMDGNVYKTVKIGSQVWMAENLKVTRYRNGDPIPNVTSNSQWTKLRTGAYCNYDNNLENVSTYGRLYNWYAVTDRRNIAPKGWHVPTDEEWNLLEKHLGANAGGNLKERGTAHWKSPNVGATNASGFTALPGGCRGSSGGACYDVGSEGGWWSSTAKYNGGAWYRNLDYEGSVIYRSDLDEHYGFSVRLVRD